MKASNTQLALAITAALVSTSALADNDTQKLQAQLDALQKEVNALKTSSSFNLEFGGRVQLDYNYFEGAYNADNDGSGGSDFFPRRIRTYVESEHGNWDHKLLLEFGEGDAEIVLARVRYAFENGLKIKAGKIREDMSLNALTSSKHINTIERSAVANTFSPFFRWGVSAYQYFKDSGFRYAIGVYKNDAFGATGNDENDRLTLAITGRATWSSTAPGDVIHLGAWHSYRDMGGNELGARFARGEVRETNVRLVNYAAGGATVALDSLSQSGLEFAFQADSLTLEAEYASRALDALDSSDDLDAERFDGFHVSASYFLGGEQRQYKAGSALFVQPKNIKNAWELVARVSQMDATSKNQGSEVTTFTLGTSYYVSSDIKFMGNLIYSDVEGPGTAALVGDEDSGMGFSARMQYLF
ncbi:porin [Pseudoalteromonas sp. S3785]|uniref:OprO/OprP family phosphate-selective porin n=1 Tax=Pseudoalteromonas sp. S3785 TaxID=579545 RepID=UPI00110AC72D|nr:porin [Pseudoalteromonas sp. S3785]TMO73369.1 porin [Pseudoalteromonas sp. S3785]